MMTQFLTENEPVGPVIPGGAYVVSANGRNVNLRAAPTTSSKAIKSFKVGTPLTIITRGVDWYYICINGYYGYMMRQFIADIQQPTAPYQSVYPEGTFQTAPVAETQYQPVSR